MKLVPRLACLFLPFILLACSQAQSLIGGSTTLQIDPADPCRQQRQHFAEGQNYFTQAIFVKVGEGAFKAAAPSILNGNFSGAVTNVLNGAFAGAKAGYLEALQQQSRDQQQLSQTINADLQRESHAIDHTTAAFGTLRTCRLSQATRIKNDARYGRLNRSEAGRQLKQQHDWFSEEITVAENAGINMQKRDDQFAYAAENAHAKTPSGSPQSPSEAALTQTATETIPQKRNSFESSVKEAQAESSTAFSLDASAAIWKSRYA